MFFLSLIEHSLRLPPILLELPLNEGLKIELEKLFLDKVIANLGLCISIYDIRSIDGGDVFPGEGAPSYTVNFRVIMFRPYPGEVLVAKLKECNSEGLHLSLGFFDDIHVPSILIPKPSRYEANTENPFYNCWIWDFGETTDDNEVNTLYIDGSCEIRFRVHAVTYPPLPIEQSVNSKPFAPMKITGAIDFDGLGPISWWQDKDDQEGEEDEEAEPES